MSHFHIKDKNGRPYLYIRHMQRVDGRPKVISQTYVGTPEKVEKLARNQDSKTTELRVKEFGGLWLANQIDKDISLSDIINSIIPSDRKEKPSTGDYFLYRVFNQMVQPVKLDKQEAWYQKTDIKHIQQGNIDGFSTKGYWDALGRVSNEDLVEIVHTFFKRTRRNQQIDSSCLLYDTTQRVFYMDDDKESRYKGKLGLEILAARNSGLPIEYNDYDDGQLETAINAILGKGWDLGLGLEEVTVVSKYGVKSNTNYAWIDEHPQVHFIVSCPPSFDKELAKTPLDRFRRMEIQPNSYSGHGKEAEELRAYRTDGRYWGKDLTAIITYDPFAVFSTRSLRFFQNRDTAPYNDEFSVPFREDREQVDSKQHLSGKRIIITDQNDWDTNEIIQASLDRDRVETRIRTMQGNDIVGEANVHNNWGSKIKCHMFTCVASLTYLCLIQLRLKKAGITESVVDVMEEMQHLHSVKRLTEQSTDPIRRIETPSKIQNKVLQAFGYYVDSRGEVKKL